MLIRLAQCFRLLLREGNEVRKDEDGQIIVFTALAGLVLVMMVVTIFNVGMVIGEKMKVQNAADTAAYSQAVWEARVLNFIAYTNRSIISHMVTIAFCTAVYSQEKLWQKIETATSTISWVPIIGTIIHNGAKLIHTIWQVAKIAAGPVRAAALVYTYAYLVYQTALVIEAGTRIELGTLFDFVVEDVDPDIKINKGLLGVGLNTFNLYNFIRIITVPPSSIDFNSIKDVYRNSCDGFSAGTSMPRTFWIKIPPFFALVKFGPTGNLNIKKKRIGQSENFSIRYWEPDWDDWFDYDDAIPPIKIAEVKYNQLKLGSHMFYNYKMPSDKADRHPSVYTYAQKESGDILQIPLMGLENTSNIDAFARAEVFYWDADRSRSKTLSSMNPSREPNLFNPFWHARLAPANAILDEIPILGSLKDYMPLTH